MNYTLIKREIETEFGKEIAVIKKHNLNKEQYKDRLWVFQPQDPEYIHLNEQMIKKGIWQWE